MRRLRAALVLGLVTVPALVPACVCGGNDASAPVAPAAQPANAGPGIARPLKSTAAAVQPRQFRVLDYVDGGPARADDGDDGG